MKGISSQHRITPWQIKKGYVFLPKDIESEKRSQYIATCRRRNRVSLIIEDGGGVAFDCYIMKHAMQDIIFPSEFGKTGSAVLVYIDPVARKPIVLGIIPKEDEIDLSGELERGIKSQDGNNSAEVTVDGSDGTVNITANADDSDGGVLNINIANSGRTGKLNLNVVGSADVYVKDAYLSSSETQIRSQVDDVDTGNSHFVDITGTKVNIDALIETNDSGEIIFNQNALSSFMADINKLVTKMNNLENKVNDLVEQINSAAGHIHISAAPLSPTSTPLSSTSTPLTLPALTETVVDDIKDPNIKN